MGDVRNLVQTSLVSDVVNQGRKILVGHLVETEVEVIETPWFKYQVLPAVNITSIISQPNIVTSIH